MAIVEPPRTHRPRTRDPRSGRPTRAERRTHERFARAVEGDRDADFAGELAVVAALRDLGDRLDTDRDGALTPDARARITDRVLTAAETGNTPESDAPETDAPESDAAPAAQPTTSRPDLAPEPSGRDRRRRRAPVVAAGVAAMLGLGAGTLLAAEDARPGETLYGARQLSEQASLGMTLDEQDRAYKHLGYASDRLGELTTLAAAGNLDRESYATGIDDFTAHTHDAASTLTTLATSSDGRQLDRLREWADAQGAHVAALPNGPRELLSRVADRAAELGERMDCTRITSGDRDDLGVVPATGACTAPGAGDEPRPDRQTVPDDEESARDPDVRDDAAPDRGANDDPREAVTLTGTGSGAAASDEPERPTPPWTPPEPAPAPEPADDVPAPRTGPRLPDADPEPEPERPAALTSLLPDLGGVSESHG